jgi:hypothetical protein
VTPQPSDPRPPSDAGLSPEARRQLRTRAQALRLGATCTALLGGVGCYIFLVEHGSSPVLAFVVGLVFAVLGRAALSALAAEWLLTVARRRDASRTRDGERNGGPPAERRTR